MNEETIPKMNKEIIEKTVPTFKIYMKTESLLTSTQ